MKKIEQIQNGLVVFDSDTTLSRTHVSERVHQDFGATGTGNPYQFDFNGHTYQLLIKQVTYLGHPHLEFKKRIQIPSSWGELLRNPNTLLVGLYQYKSTVIYVFFGKAQYSQRPVNNSSAHVHTIDLQKAQEYGIFTKTDMGGNVITAVRQSFVHQYLQQLDTQVKTLSPEIQLFEDFAHVLSNSWQGIKCYQEMMDACYKDKFQAEWAGFYLEFQFERFLNEKPERLSICTKQKNKKTGEIDLDLSFNMGTENQFLGDLKAHSNSSKSVLGNDSGAVENALNSYNRVWYVVVSHDTGSDSKYDFITTRFWNNAQGKDDSLSYSKRMKHSVRLTHLEILEINAYNQQYLDIFKQGANSDGNVRAPKISIPKKSFNNFLLYKTHF